MLQTNGFQTVFRGNLGIRDPPISSPPSRTHNEIG